METPTWLTLSFVEKVLRKSEGDNSIEVIDIFSKPAVAKGDNYTSDMIRITVEFSRDQGGHRITEKKSIIAKISPTEGVRQKIIEHSGIFHTETLMMSDTLDKMNKLLGDEHRLSGKILYVQKENPMFLMIEDLTPLGFHLAADRQSGLDLAHCILALQGLARFHAASVAICEKEPNLKEIYSKGAFHKDNPPEMINYFASTIKGLADEITNWPEMEKYSEKVAKHADHAYEMGIDITKCCEDEFNVINHGDFWANNLLFKYDNNNKPVQCIFVDFQWCAYTSPAIDLLHFFNTSPSLDVIENKKSILLNKYFETLVATMKQLGCKTQPPTMEKLKVSLKQKARYGMIISFTVLPVALCSKTEVKDLDELMNPITSLVHPGLKSENYKKMMIKKLPLYNEWGLLDF